MCGGKGEGHRKRVGREAEEIRGRKWRGTKRFCVTTQADGEGYRQPRRSQRSFRLASAAVCHCMLEGSSRPPQASGTTWSTTYPGRPRGYPVRLKNSRRARGLRRIRPCPAPGPFIDARWLCTTGPWVPALRWRAHPGAAASQAARTAATALRPITPQSASCSQTLRPFIFSARNLYRANPSTNAALHSLECQHGSKEESRARGKAG